MSLLSLVSLLYRRIIWLQFFSNIIKCNSYYCCRLLQFSSQLFAGYQCLSVTEINFIVPQICCCFLRLYDILLADEKKIVQTELPRKLGKQMPILISINFQFFLFTLYFNTFTIFKLNLWCRSNFQSVTDVFSLGHFANVFVLNLLMLARNGDHI